MKIRIKKEKKRPSYSGGSTRRTPCTRITTEELKVFSEMPIKFHTGQRGSRLLEVAGYTYVKNRICDTKTYWICARKVRIQIHEHLTIGLVLKHNLSPPHVSSLSSSLGQLQVPAASGHSVRGRGRASRLDATHTYARDIGQEAETVEEEYDHLKNNISVLCLLGHWDINIQDLIV